MELIIRFVWTGTLAWLSARNIDPTNGTQMESLLTRLKQIRGDVVGWSYEPTDERLSVSIAFALPSAMTEIGTLQEATVKGASIMALARGAR